jgi:nitroimidazol reductase NimA-like FMN-containing flavoprotein (pyridoxamine 5'-phosphate oxidase superfamily)
MGAEPVDNSGLAILIRADCMRLLERGGVGRIAVAGEPVPTVRPVNFALRSAHELVPGSAGCPPA